MSVSFSDPHVRCLFVTISSVQRIVNTFLSNNLSICLYFHLCVSALSVSMLLSICSPISVFLIFCNFLSIHKSILFIAKPEARYTMFLQLSRPMFPSYVQKCIQTFARLTFRRPITSVTLFLYIIRTFHNVYKCYRFRFNC